ALGGADELFAVELDRAFDICAEPLREPEDRHRRHRLARARLAGDADALARGDRELGHVGDHASVECDLQLRDLELHRAITRLGSRRSRRPSPRRLNATALKRIAAPGNVTTHQYVWKKLRPSFTIRPHSGVGSWAPRPRKESAAAVRITPPKSSDI